MNVEELEIIRAWMVRGKVLELTSGAVSIVLHPLAFAPADSPQPQDKPKLTPEQIANRRKFAHVGGGG